MRRWPLRWKIAGWSALATGLALLTFGAAMAYVLYAEQVEMIDDRLAASANLLIARQSPGAPVDLATLESLLVRPAHRRQANASLFGFMVVNAGTGEIVAAQPEALRESARPWPPPKRHFNRRIETTRVRIGAFALQGNTVLLAASLEPADESVGDLVGAAAVAFPIVLLVVAAGSWWIARRALSPIAAITRTAEAITATNLAARLAPPASDDEIGAHVRVLNEMFDRLQRSFEQATRFTADAAHELRTPLTILRGQIEEALRGHDLPPPQEQLLIALLEETSGLQKITDNLLLLARFDRGRGELHHADVNLSALLTEALEDAELLATPQHIAVHVDIAPDIRIAADAVMLRRMALNLIDNAIKYNRPTGELRASLRNETGVAIFTIGNTGTGIPPKRRATLFERFYRTDAGRSREAGGSGLGLSLCREIVVAHGGTIELTRSDPQWTEFTVRLPAPEAPHDSARPPLGATTPPPPS